MATITEAFSGFDLTADQTEEIEYVKKADTMANDSTISGWMNANKAWIPNIQTAMHIACIAVFAQS